MLHPGESFRPPEKPAAWQQLLLAVLPVLLAAALASAVTIPAIPTWYVGLTKPGFTPPNGVFTPVWTVLYAMMAYSAWRVLSLPGSRSSRRSALTAFFVQLALNAAWSWAFFGARSPFAGLVVIVALLVAIAITIRLFWRLDRLAAWLLVPYAGWVAYATALNAAIWQLNA